MAGVKSRARKRAQAEKNVKRITQLEQELLAPGSWPPSNPKLATARWHLVSELACLKGVKVKTIKTWLEEHYDREGQADG